MPEPAIEPPSDSLAQYFRCAQCGEPFEIGDSVMFCSERCGDLFDADLRNPDV
jgi:predicted nucleic acid-binding Zn ribbon protein